MCQTEELPHTYISVQCRQCLQQSKDLQRGLCIEEGEGAIGEWEHRWALAALLLSAYGRWLPVPAHGRELNQATSDDHKDEGKTHWKNNQWMAGIRDKFSPQDLAGKGNGTVLFLSAVFHHSARRAASCGTMLCYGTVRGTAANSSSALQLSLFLRSVQVEPDCVPEPLWAQHTSKMRKIILSTVNAHTGKNSETQTKPLACGFFHCTKQRQCCCSH